MGLDTRDQAYTRRLQTLGEVGLKRWLDVQMPYRWHLRRLRLGFTLDIGCGTGRNLAHLNGHGVGLDHNPHSVEAVRARGFTAFTPETFEASPYGSGTPFDSLLMAHVAEHMWLDDARALLERYVPRLREGGRVVIITPQEAGFATDPTHVEFMDHRRLAMLLDLGSLRLERRYSYPFPRVVGRWFPHNEFVALARKISVRAR